MMKKTYIAPATEMIAVAQQSHLLNATIKKTEEDNWAEGKENFMDDNASASNSYNIWDNWDED